MVCTYLPSSKIIVGVAREKDISKEYDLIHALDPYPQMTIRYNMYLYQATLAYHFNRFNRSGSPQKDLFSNTHNMRCIMCTICVMSVSSACLVCNLWIFFLWRIPRRIYMYRPHFGQSVDHRQIMPFPAAEDRVELLGAVPHEDVRKAAGQCWNGLVTSYDWVEPLDFNPHIYCKLGYGAPINYMDLYGSIWSLYGYIGPLMTGTAPPCIHHLSGS